LYARERALRGVSAVSLEASRRRTAISAVKFFLGRAGDTRGHAVEAMRSVRVIRSLLVLHHQGCRCLSGRGVMGSSLRKSVEISLELGLSQFVLAGALRLPGCSRRQPKVCRARRLALFHHHGFRGSGGDNPVYLAQREALQGG
jgi:hypothetical protein